MPAKAPPGTSSFQATFGSMSDSQLRQTISQLSSAASASQSTYPQGTYRSPLPQASGTAAYFDPKQWAGSPATKSTSTRQRNRASRANASAASTPLTSAQSPFQHASQATPIPATSIPSTPIPPAPVPPPNPPRAPLSTAPQALQTTYPSRLRTGTTLLMQPILATTTGGLSGGRVGTRRGGIINYAEPTSGDELDAGAVDTDDSDFVASGGTRSAIRASRASKPWGTTASFYNIQSGSTTNQTKLEVDQSYLGQIPPTKYISSKRAEPTKHEYASQDALEAHAQKSSAYIPVRVEFETDTHRIRDCFVWNLHESLVKPEMFAKIFCNDLDLPTNPWVETITNQIKAQIEEHEGVASMDLGAGLNVEEEVEGEGEIPECRVILSIDVQIATYHLLDHIEWDLLSTLTPEVFSQQLCADLGLSGEAVPLIAHAIHEEILRHKKDSIEWGVIGGDKEAPEEPIVDKPRDKSGLSLLKDKTGLGLGGWGRTPKDGRGPKTLKSIWKDWQEANDYATRFEVLSMEEVERREIERERASRRLRRETSKFQFQASTRTRRR